MSDLLFRLTDLHYAPDPERPVLCGVNFDLCAGERVALTGANGAGKTTLLHLMEGLLTPDKGTIWAFGKIREREQDFREVRTRAGLLFQDSDDQLFCPTVLEDVSFGPLNLGKSAPEARAIAERTLDKLGLAGFEQRITYRLSGGEKRLIALATVLAMEPDILLLDEPGTGLDVDMEQRLSRILQNLAHTMVIISHDTAFLDRLCTRSVRLREGVLMPHSTTERSP